MFIDFCPSNFLGGKENFAKKRESCQSLVYGVVGRFYSQQKEANKIEDDAVKQENGVSQVSWRSKAEKKLDKDSGLGKYTSDDEDLLGDSKWKLELAWLSKALEPALQLCKWALPAGLFMSTMILHKAFPIRKWQSLYEFSDSVVQM